MAKKKKKKTKKRKELTYEKKAIEMASVHWEKQKEKAIHERRAFRGLQIIPTASYYDESKGHKPGENNWTGFGFDLHPQVSLVAGGLVVLFIVLTLTFREQSALFFQNLLDGIGNNFGWFYILAANFFVITMVLIAVSDYGKIRIGGPDALPEFSTFSWYAMLISAGMGIGLMFWSVAEPVFHYITPSPMFNVEAQTAESAQVALGLTYYHWGIHPWGIYALVGLSLAFFAYNRGLPLTIRSIFYPLLGEKIYGFWGNIIDILSVLATLFGLATSLGLGIKQISSGLNYLFGFPVSTEYQVLLIAVITFFAVLSIITGLDKGVKMLSMANMVAAGVFMLFLLIVGPTVYILKAFTQDLGFYIQNLPQLSFWVETFYGAEGSNWQNSWTIFYWGWWISWSPFVGMFIARISKGRTVREFILGVMVFPTLLSFLVDVVIRRHRTLARADEGCRYRRSGEVGCLDGTIRDVGTVSPQGLDLFHGYHSGHDFLYHLLGFGLPGCRSSHVRRKTRFPCTPAHLLGHHGRDLCRGPSHGRRTGCTSERLYCNGVAVYNRAADHVLQPSTAVFKKSNTTRRSLKN